jgi:class 3 adenylate cyclase
MGRRLPSATVTFLFTDVEGSTRLLHELGAEPYAEALGEHRRALRAVFAAEGGVEVDTQGDGVTARAQRLAVAGAVHLSLLAPDGNGEVEYQDVVERVRAACDVETWERASVEGRAMTLDQAAHYALS